MPRPRAPDHEAKRQAILDRSAELFAAQGYARTSMAAIAGACGTSKALLYHYYANKEQLLFDLLKKHFERLEATVVAADEPRLDPNRRLRGLVRALLDAYVGANALHKVQINDCRRCRRPAGQLAMSAGWSRCSPAYWPTSIRR
jgi:TetR/AcrR family transcriptional regulator